MCYRYVNHKSICDVRPLISDGKKLMVSGYEDPGPCRCTAQDRTIHECFRCAEHACCMVTVRVRLCTRHDLCTSPLDVHRYEARTHRGAPMGRPWPRYPVLDEDFHLWYASGPGVPYEGWQVMEYRVALSDTGRRLAEAGREFWRRCDAAWGHLLEHRRRHGEGCEARGGECPENGVAVILAERVDEALQCHGALRASFKLCLWLVASASKEGGRNMSGLDVPSSGFPALSPLWESSSTSSTITLLPDHSPVPSPEGSSPPTSI